MAADKKAKTGSTKKLYKSRKDKIIDGVCGGVSEYFNIDVTMLRVIWLLLIFFNGIGIIGYVAAMIIMQVNPEHKNLKEGEIKQHNSSLFWGIVLIIFGIIFLFRNLDFHYGFFPNFFPFFSYHAVQWSVLFAIVLIGLGIFYIINVFKSEESKENANTKFPPLNEGKRFFKSSNDKKISGVCGGIAEYFSIDPTLVRLGFVVFIFLTDFVIGIVAYIILAIVLPNREDVEEINEKAEVTGGGNDEK